MGDFIPAQPVTQSYQTDDQFYDVDNGGNFESGSADQINDELDRLLEINNPSSDDGRNTDTQNDSRFNAFLEEQRQQREYERQQFQSRQQQDAQARREQETQLERERLKQEAELRAKAYRPQFATIAITEDQKKAYADADPYIRSIVSEMLGHVWDNGISPALTDQQHSILDLAKRPTQTSLSVEQQIALSRPNVNSIVAEPEFARYLTEPVEGTGMTRRDIMNFAYQKNDVASVITMLDSYTSSKANARPNRSASPIGSVHSAPQGGQGGRQQRMRPYSDLGKAQAQFRQGRITRDKLVDIENHFESLAQSGLVDYSK